MAAPIESRPDRSAALLSVAQVARLLAVRPDHVYRLIQSGRLAALNVAGSPGRACWRIRPEELDEFLGVVDPDRVVPTPKKATPGRPGTIADRLAAMRHHQALRGRP